MLLLAALLSLAVAAPVREDVRVATTEELRRALASAKPGTRILVAPGVYERVVAGDVRGAAGRPVVVTAADPERRPVFKGGLHLTDPSYVELSRLVVAEAPGNGLNVDDGGTFETPARGVVLREIHVRDCGGSGNDDGIKLSGVEDFLVEDCVVERWGRGGSGVDLVGCRRGALVRCVLRDRAAGAAANGVQLKGGTRDVGVRACRFEHAGSRAINLGGSTGRAYFRPRPEGFEAKDLVVEGCTFVGSQAPIACVGVDGAVVRRNTFFEPAKWVVRILQETRDADFVPCRGVRFEENLVVYRGADVATAVNVGPGTAPETFVFARNYWFRSDDPRRSAPPGLPVAEKDGAGGRDPKFRDALAGDFRLAADSPARGFGADAFDAAASRR